MTEEKEDQVIELPATKLEISTPSPSIFLGPSPYKELQNKEKELLESLAEFENVGNFLQERKDNLALFFLIAKEKLEDLGAELATQEIIKDFKDGEINESAVINELKTKKIYAMLKCYKIISEEEMNTATNIIDLRGNLAHDPKSRYNHERLRKFESIESEIEDTMDILETMKSKVNENKE